MRRAVGHTRRRYATEPELLWLDTDKALHTDARFKPFFELYARDQRAFFRDFSAAMVKLSECGSKFEPAEGIRIDCPHMLRAKLEAVAVQPTKVKAASSGGDFSVAERAAVASSVPRPPRLTQAEVKLHKTAKDAWIVLHGNVYDVTGFLSSHPVRTRVPSARECGERAREGALSACGTAQGGKQILLKHCGKDATEEFEMIHPPNTLKNMASKIQLLGKLDL